MQSKGIPGTWKARAFEYRDGTKREVIASVLDKTSSDKFIINPSFGVYHNLYLRFHIKNNGSSAETLRLTVTGATSGYEQQTLNGTTISNPTANSFWTVATVAGNDHVSGSLTITGGGLASADMKPKVTGDVTGNIGQDTMLKGQLNSTTNHVQQLKLDTTNVAFGRAVLIGEVQGSPNR